MNFYTISHLRGFDFMQNTHSIFPVILLCMKSFWKMLQFDCLINPCRFLPLSTSTQFLWLMRNWSSFLNWKWKSQTRQFYVSQLCVKTHNPPSILSICLDSNVVRFRSFVSLYVCPVKKEESDVLLNTYLQAFFKNSIHSVFHWWFLVQNFIVEINFTRTLIRLKKIWLSSHKIYVNWQYIYLYLPYCYKCIWGNSRIILIELWLWGVSI